MIDYTKFITDAAIEYRNARTNNCIERTEETAKEESKYWGKLCWMIDAKKYNWNPEEFTWECIE